MIAIRGLEMPKDCKKCSLMGTDGKDILSPMMCVAIWATKHEIKHCVGGMILDDCPLVEIGTCKDCNLWCKDMAIDGACFCSSFHTYTGYEFYCGDFEK